MSNITEGEWDVKIWDGDEWPENRVSIGQKHGRQYCVAISPRYGEREQVIKDFQVISAVPKMIDALIELVTHTDKTTSGERARQKGIEALKKAGQLE